jgi:hypothetical protein
MDRLGPVPVATGVAAADDESHRYATSKQAPLSGAFGWPLIARNNLPFTDFWGFQALSEGVTWISRLFPPLGKPKTKVPVGQLSRGVTWVSKILPAVGKSKTKVPFGQISNGVTFLGPKSLKANPSPLSSMFGLPVLSRK